VQTPYEFMGKWGQCNPRLVPIKGGTTRIIEPNPNRYLLVFWALNGTVDIFPGYDETFAGFGFVMSPSTQPIMMSHALHGALVNMGWSAGNSPATINLLVIEGFMRSPDDG
jgi:hypothetical protein